MNITALRPRLICHLEPVGRAFARAGLTPNQISLLSLLLGVAAMLLYAVRSFALGSVLLFASAVLDLVDGHVARIQDSGTRFGAVFDWIADKYVDTLAMLGVGISGIPIISWFTGLPPVADSVTVMIAIIGSMMNTFIKPVVYAEAGYAERHHGKIDDPLEGVGFFGRPETLLVLVVGGLTGLMWAAIIIIAVATNLSAIERILYLRKHLGESEKPG
ncbi:MAG TPA: CDP-alcohol phosphatidyltransferase family protein [Methanomicrobiales archaeon]|jgi:archaetidylinositol phosphate synthase|nr:CDP-alcohol phosphatidyltransferase family protein [Methanomicrobiales archaeon]